MRAVVQRAERSQVDIGGETVARTGAGFVVFVGIKKGDTGNDVEYLSRKVASLRIFPDDSGKMAANLAKSGGEALVVSQFTLYADCGKGGRPSFDRAESFEKAESLYNMFVSSLAEKGIKVSEGRFGAEMKVHIVNAGPVTILLDSEKIV